MEHYTRVLTELKNIYDNHTKHNLETKFMSGITNDSLTTLYDNTVTKINDEKNIYTKNLGIYKFISGNKVHKDNKFNSNLLDHLNYFKKATRSILPARTINDIENYKLYQKEQYVNEKKRKHSELLKSDKAVFLADKSIIQAIKTKRRYLF